MLPKHVYKHKPRGHTHTEDDCEVNAATYNEWQKFYIFHFSIGAVMQNCTSFKIQYHQILCFVFLRGMITVWHSTKTQLDFV
jgi:hypothetical protein